MSTFRIGMIIVAACTLTAAMCVQAQEIRPLQVWKNRDGQIVSEQSRDDAKQMRKYVAKHGQIELTITFNVKYDPSVDPESADQQNQQAAVDQMYVSIIEPLVASGVAWHPFEELVRAGPVAVVGVNIQGLISLLKSSKVQIITSNIPYE